MHLYTKNSSFLSLEFLLSTHPAQSIQIPLGVSGCQNIPSGCMFSASGHSPLPLDCCIRISSYSIRMPHSPSGCLVPASGYPPCFCQTQYSNTLLQYPNAPQPIRMPLCSIRILPSRKQNFQRTLVNSNYIYIYISTYIITPMHA